MICFARPRVQSPGFARGSSRSLRTKLPQSILGYTTIFGYTRGLFHNSPTNSPQIDLLWGEEAEARKTGDRTRYTPIAELKNLKSGNLPLVAGVVAIMPPALRAEIQWQGRFIGVGVLQGFEGFDLLAQ